MRQSEHPDCVYSGSAGSRFDQKVPEILFSSLSGEIRTESSSTDVNINM